MVSQSESGFSDNLYFGQAIHRPVRYTPEPETANICLSSSGTRSVFNRCTESELAGNGGICICTISSDSNLSKDNFGRGISSVRDCHLWIGHVWFPPLLKLLVAPAVYLPWRKDLLCQ